MSEMSPSVHVIERLGHLGDGIAAGPIFAPRCLPGEEVSGDVVSGRIEAPKIIRPSPERVSAPCPHYNACGGCALLHASDEFVANWKVDVIQSALASQGLFPPMRKIEISPTQSRRRAVLSARRGKKGAIIGFHGRKSGTITGIQQCKLLVPEITEALPALSELATVGASRKGEISINVVYSHAGLDVSVTGGKPLQRELETVLAQSLRQHGFARLAWDGEVVATETAPSQRFGGADVVPPSGAFLQATREGEAALVDAAKEAVGGAKNIVDLFAGCGTFTLPLAETAEVHAVEGEADMLVALDAGWRKSTGLRRVTTEKRDLFREPLHTDDLGGFDGAVIDPPRAGAEAQIAQLVESGISKIAMISCNPVTFARDAKALVDAGYTLNWVLPVDQFRWSTHVELASQFTKP